MRHVTCASRAPRRRRKSARDVLRRRVAAIAPAPKRRRHAPARARRRRRLPQPARPRPEGDGRRRAARGRAHAGRTTRLEPPGPVPADRREPDLEQATWLAFLFALAPELQRADRRDAPARGRTPTSTRCPRPRPSTAAAYRAWVERAGSQEAAFTGEESWTPERRFGRVFERLALPGFTRAARYDLLTALGAAGRLPARGRRACTSSRTTRRRSPPSALLVSGDRMLLERRATRPRRGRRAADRRASTAASPCGARRASTST